MNSSLTKLWQRYAVRPVVAATLAVALVGGFATYEFVRPEPAQAAVAAPAPPAAALDDNSVGSLIAEDKAMETLAARVTPAVVNVAVTSRTKAQAMEGPDDMQRFFGQFFGPQGPQFRQAPQQQVEHGVGSGVVISPDGYIVTNNHVVEGATDLRVTTSDRRVYSAKVVGADALTDLAVIKVDAKNMASIPWGDSQTLRPGQTVLAFGNPFGFRFSVTRGIVSALNRSNPYNTDPRKPGEYIQTDAAINPGNSGGPLVDVHGQVVGINTFLISATGAFSGMGFAIPTQVAKSTVDTLIRYGKVEHSHMGVGITDVTPDNAKFFNLKDASGALISQVDENSPGDRAGLKVGDVVTQVNRQSVESAGQLQVLVGQQRPGTTIKLTVVRDGKTMEIPVTLESMDKKSETITAGNGHGKARWGVGLADVTPDVRQELDLPAGVKGAVVGQVEPGSPADNAGLARGDVILQVNRKDTPDASAVKEALGKVPAGDDALLLVRSGGGNTFRVMHSAEAASGD